MAAHWALDPDIVYLNHGSFGACPTEVLHAQQGHRDRMEAEGVRFFVHDLPELADRARAALAPIVGAATDDLALCTNATQAVTTVFDNLDLKPGDEILVNTHEYNACVANARRAAARAGAKLVTVDLPWPVESEEQMARVLLDAVTDRTRIVLVSLITSPSAIIMPIQQLADELHPRGIEILLDAAHGPGCIPLDLHSLGVAYATGNCHKWLCAPKGSAFLYVRDDLRPGFRPMVLSNDAFDDVEAAAAAKGRKTFHLEFDYCGTHDPTGVLTIADAAHWLEAHHEDGLPGIMQHNRALTLHARSLLCEALEVEPPVPDSMVGPIAAIALPPHTPEQHQRLMTRPSSNHDALWGVLERDWRIQVPIWRVPGGAADQTPTRRTVRLSAQLYNSPDQYAYLAEALTQELVRERDFA